MEFLLKDSFKDLIIKNIADASAIVNGSMLICNVVPKIWVKYAPQLAIPLVSNKTLNNRVINNIAKDMKKILLELDLNSLLSK